VAGSFARHVTRYLHGGFWTSVFAAVLNGVYWRVTVSEPVRYLLMGSTLLVAAMAIVLNARVLRQLNAAGGRLGRRVTWLLLLTGVLVVASVAVDITGLPRIWGLP
jgi:hypothetical protein